MGFPRCRAQAAGSQASAVLVHGLRCPEVCVVLVPGPGIEPMSPALEGGFLTTGPPGKSLYGILEGIKWDKACENPSTVAGI